MSCLSDRLCAKIRRGFFVTVVILMIRRFFAIALKSKIPFTVSLALCPLLLATCSSLLRSPSPTPVPSATPSPGPLVAYLFEGQIWTLAPGSSDAKPTRVGGEQDTVDEFLWSSDGKSLYLALGLNLVGLAIESGTRTDLGTITAPPGTTLDRLQMAAHPDLIIVHTSDADAAAHIYSFDIKNKATRELTVDEYVDLSPVESPVVHGFAELSVSPDLARVLFKGTVGSCEQLFVADLEKGYRSQLTSLEALDGFEESAEFEGGRRIIAAAWSPDGKSILFNPAQSCSDSGLCYGQLFIVDSLSGAQRRLSQGMMVGLDAIWNKGRQQSYF
jgi:hypothetical protein